MKRIAPLLALFLGTCATTPPRDYRSPEEAVADLVAAFEADDLARAEAALGGGAEAILYSGDAIADASGRREFLRLYAEKHRLEADAEDRRILRIGELDWPVPVPLVRSGAGWHFDADAGLQEILARRVGANELSTIQVCFACRDAQREYAAVDRDGDGILEYAARFLSSEGKQDGLFWPVADGEAPSPLGPLVAEAVREGYGRGEGPRPYHGYLFRMLTAQGENAPGGAYEYVVDGHPMGGFAIVAYPAEYGNSGVMTFLVSHDGAVYEKDLGDATTRVAEAMEAFDPDSSWGRVEE